MPEGNGQPLPADVQSKMENSFGADFSDVRIHTDNSAKSLNGAMGAKAYTVGSDIYFSSGQYSPHSQHGQHLIAHELTHVMQQGQGKAGGNGAGAPVPDLAVQAKLNGHLAAGGMKAVIHGLTNYLPSSK